MGIGSSTNRYADIDTDSDIVFFQITPNNVGVSVDVVK